MFRSLSAILLLLLGCAALPAHAGGTKSLAEKFVAAEKPAALPSFIFKDGAGKELRLEAFKGRPVLLNIWATWCTPCVAEMPTLDRLQAIFGKDQLVVMALALDRGGEAKVPSFYQRHGIKNLDLFLDTTGQAMFTLKLRGLPTTILLNAKGEEVGRVEGDLDWAAAETVQFLSERLDIKPINPKP